MKNLWQYLFAVALLGCAVEMLIAEENETKVSLDQVPTQVKKGIEAAVGEGKLIDIGKINSNGRTTYEIEMQINGKEVDVLFDDSGTELQRETQPEEDEEGAKNKEEGDAESDDFQSEFDLEHRSFTTTGRNRYFVLEPNYQLVLQGKVDGREAQLQITVLSETRSVGGIPTRVVEERETVDGQLLEVSRNFFAICKASNSVFYFGEEVDIYRDGKIVDHEGAWLHGKDKARAGMMMPGECITGAAYYQEFAPKVAMDRAWIEEVTATIVTPAGRFSNCLKVREENPLDGDSETKTFAPDIGLVQDEGLLLVKHGFVDK